MSARFLSSFPLSPEESYSKSPNIRSHWLRRRDDNEPIFCVSVCDYRQNKQSKKTQQTRNQTAAWSIFFSHLHCPCGGFFTSLGWHRPALVTSNLTLPAYPHYQQTNNEQWLLWSIQTNLHTHKSLIWTYPRHIKREWKCSKCQRTRAGKDCMPKLTWTWTQIFTQHHVKRRQDDTDKAACVCLGVFFWTEQWEQGKWSRQNEQTP